MIARVLGWHREPVGLLQFGRSLGPPRLWIELDGDHCIRPWTPLRLGDAHFTCVSVAGVRLALRTDGCPIDVQGRPGVLVPDDSDGQAATASDDAVPVGRFQVTVRDWPHRAGRAETLDCIWLGRPVLFRDVTAPTHTGDGATFLVRHAPNMGVTSAELTMAPAWEAA